MECQEAAKTTKTAAKEDGRSWEMCAHRKMGAQEGTTVIYFVIQSLFHVFRPS